MASELAAENPVDAENQRPPAAPRLLCVCDREPSWVTLTMALGSTGLAVPRLVWVSSGREALAQIRDEPFECAVIDAPTPLAALRSDGCPFALVKGMRTAGYEDPIVLVGRVFGDREWIEASEADCDVFLASRRWESPGLGPVLKRALERGALLRESRRLAAANHRRLLRERDEAEQLLAQQRQIIAELEALPGPLEDALAGASFSAPTAESTRPTKAVLAGGAGKEFVALYEGLLRSYVLMGSGSLAGEIRQLADRFVAARLSPSGALQLHLQCVEGLVKGLGNRSGRHVLARADLLAVEMMTHLAHLSHRARDGRAPTSGGTPHIPLRNVSGAAGIDLTSERGG